MKCEIIYTKKALKNLKKLPLNQACKIVKKISYYCRPGEPLSFAKRLKHPAFGEYRFRIGDFRAIFDLDKKGNINILYILTIRHRKDVYKNL